MNRNDFQILADIRINEARALLDAGLFDGAYYLGGYAVECALKSCIARQTREFDFPDKRLVNQMYTHDLGNLVGVAGLRQGLDEAMKLDATLAANWAVVKDWGEESRYRRYAAAAARELLSAVTDTKSGVLQWLKLHW